MKSIVRIWLGALLALSGLSIGVAATFQVDDSRSVVLNTNIPLQWRSLSPATGDHQVQGVTRVQIKLDLRPWAGQAGRVYMALPPQPNGQVQAAWQGQGTLLNGQLTSGQRGLVWSGTMPAGLLEDLLTVTIQTDGRWLSSAQSLRFYFEVDVP
jgi:hypothetical protein